MVNIHPGYPDIQYLQLGRRLFFKLCEKIGLECKITFFGVPGKQI
jgi:hypothetical protein